MSNTSKNKLDCLLYAILILLLVFTMAFSIGGSAMTANADGTGENVLYTEDFSDGIDASLSEHITIQDGAGLIAGTTLFNLPIPSMAASNNYEVSFDIKLAQSAEFYLHLVGLDGTTNKDIYMCERGNGAFWLISDEDKDEIHDIYNNTGDLHGGLDGASVDLTEFAHVKLVHFEGYLELWINGTRRCVSHLSNFGNNMYQQRVNLEEGTIKSIAIRSDAANAVVIDNIKVVEATEGETSYSEHSDVANTSSQKIFNLSAQNLYRDNFKVTGTFRVSDITKTDYFPTIKLMGLNASLLTNNQKEYSVNVQTGVNGGAFAPGIFAQVEAQDWVGSSGDTVNIEEGADVEYRIEVYGDNIDFYINDAKAVATTFTDMGVKKGHLQYIKIVSGAGGVYWTDFTYDGFEKQTAVQLSASATRVKTGETVTFNADVFGLKGEEFGWYVNGVKQAENGAVLTLENIQAGEYTVAYNSANTQSNEITVEASDKIITIASDKISAYSTDEITVTATLDGDFSGQTPEWFINDVPSETTENPLVLSGLEPGVYDIVYKSSDTVSNLISVTVLESNVEVETDKNSYYSTESATLTAILSGMSDDTALVWYVNGAVVEGETGKELVLDLADYLNGSQITVICKAGEIESDEVLITVAYDVLGTVKDNEHYKSVYKDILEEGKTYGNFSVGVADDGNYLYTEVAVDSTYYTMSAPMPSSTSFILEYKLYVPSDINGIYYVYPCLQGLNSKYPAGMVETAIEVNSNGLRPYFKDQGSSVQYTADDYGFGKDFSYEGGNAVKGGYNQIAVAVQGQYISMYINGEIAVFFKLATATVPSGCAFNIYPDGGQGIAPLRIKDIEISGIVEPAPELESVTLSVSSVNAAVNESVTLTANLNPFNAEAHNIQWYVNGRLAEGSALTYSFSATEAGTYEIHCVIDGIASAKKTVTVSAASGGETQQPLPAWAIALIAIGAVAVVCGAGAGVWFALKKKKK